tara:strand:- start:519 stop:749 length:231 start_codon:yes stop_codon:yes gene_type:complete
MAKNTVKIELLCWNDYSVFMVLETVTIDGIDTVFHNMPSDNENAAHKAAKAHCKARGVKSYTKVCAISGPAFEKDV